LFPFVEGADIVLIILLIETLNFAGVALLQPLPKTGAIVLLDWGKILRAIPKFVKQDIWIGYARFD
jgi:hypothetical protein